MNISVIGAGQMGAGIAQVFATSGHQVSLIDLNQAALDRGQASIRSSLARVVKKERITQQALNTAVANITYHMVDVFDTYRLRVVV